MSSETSLIHSLRRRVRRRLYQAYLSLDPDVRRRRNHRGRPADPSWDGERMVPGLTDEETELQHVQRYQTFAALARGKHVLDLACGSGYGTAILARQALEVVGGDVSEAAVSQAHVLCADSNVRFMVMDAEAIPFENASFDLVVSFETIEHVPHADTFLAEVARVLRPNGQFIVSTPNKGVTSPGLPRPMNPHHVVEWYPAEYRRLLEQHFTISRFVGQADASPWKVRRTFWEPDLFMIALCRPR